MAFFAEHLPVFGHDLDGGCGAFLDDAYASGELELGDADGLWLAELPLHGEMGVLSAGATTGDLHEATNLHIYSHKRSAEYAEEVPVAKHQRLEEDEWRFLLPDAPLPPAPTPEHVEEVAPAATNEFVDAAWVAGVVRSLAEVKPQDEIEWKHYLLNQYGVSSGSSAPRTGAVRKLILTDRMLLALSQACCQDTRLAADTWLALVEPDILPGDEQEETRFLRPGRNFTVHDPLAFNQAFRALQASHPSWPRPRGVPTETKGITQPLSALGLGPVESSPWNVKTLHLRGPEDTDPDTEWCAAKRQWVKRKGKRDGMYYRRYVFDAKRVASRALAAHVFATLPPAAPKW
ncbi:hypothetical protein T484DRAFT_1948215 [Baffinella frigidus]|nr:hypothetical protein T484DRAFT_1948215 [Cryptophyta sp. CCMP2293]|mmetsp:Transcript_24399/g.55597  ORF Transcript_24399/g.55597 Transcript_24399/m.55597 type:complete len:347 (+) Transcript_24399:3-1043(+)